MLDLIAARDHEALVHYARLGPDARLAVPTPDDYLPLLYCLALQRDAEPVSVVARGFDARTVSMLNLSIGT